jgi:hypothetical protein
LKEGRGELLPHFRQPKAWVYLRKEKKSVLSPSALSITLFSDRIGTLERTLIIMWRARSYCCHLLAAVDYYDYSL